MIGIFSLPLREFSDYFQVLVDQVTHRMAHVSNFKNRLLIARRKLVSGSHQDEDHSSPAHQKGSILNNNNIFVLLIFPIKVWLIL